MLGGMIKQMTKKHIKMKLKELFDKYTFDEIIKRLLKLEKGKKQRK